MAGADGFLTYPELIGEVRRLCAQRQTGCIFITTSDNHGVRFALQGGTIVAMAFRQQTGPDALTSIRRIRKGRLQFSDMAPPQEPQPGLPSTPELLSMMQGTATDPAPSRRETPAGPAPGPANESLLRSRAVIESELAEYLGPMAQVVCAEHIETAGSLSELIDTLAKELHDSGKASRFKERVRERLASRG